MINLTNKVILVSIRRIDEDGQESFDTYFAKVKSHNDNTVVVNRLDGKEEHLPYGDDFYEIAEEGFYELEDGSTFENPDYIAEFVVYKNENSRNTHINRKC